MAWRVPTRTRTDPPRRSQVGTAETGTITGTQDKDYNIIWFTEACLRNALR